VYCHGHYSRLVVDLLFLPKHAGAKRWIVKYLLYRYRCRKCHRVFNMKIGQRLIEGKYGWNLLAWVTYQNVVNGLSFLKIRKNLEDTFALGISITTLHRFKSLAASYHRRTYQELLDRIVHSPVIHVDETQFKLKTEAGYVWVLTNVDDVVFAYRSSREGRFIWELLENFDGVLVSDFYGAYDSLPCAQQKCLIHLIRDLNTDLYKNPFDKELRDICQQFGVVLRGCVETIDKHGLKKRYLQKHRKTVDRFYKTVIDRRCSSDLAIQYQKRLHKNRDRLFTFLEHDGVPWNNNNVEHAIKHLAVYRRMTNGILTQKGLEEYLILLSLYQSCTYRGQNFLDFLLSAKRRID
jgi:transposase-like protein